MKYRSYLAISRDPKLKRHDDGRELSNRNWKNLGYKPRPKFLAFQEMFAEFSTDESAPLRKHDESFHKITPFRNNEKVLANQRARKY